MTTSEPSDHAPEEAGVRLGRGRVVAILVVGLATLGLLIALGTWQLERKSWKETMLASIDARIHQPPRAVEDVLALLQAGEAIDYLPVRLRGVFDHSGERYFLATRQGEAGWHVFTPLRLDGSDRWIFVNRGFVPYAMKEPATRVAGNPSGPVEIEGLTRSAPAEKPGSFLPDNDPAKNVFFWRNVADMAQGLALPGEKVLPFFVDTGPGAAAGGVPIGGVTVIDLPNDHLQYAITWFSLALALAVMLALFVRHLVQRRRSEATG